MILAERHAVPVVDLRLLVDAGYAADVEFLPDLSRAQKQALLQSLSVLTVPTTYGESFGLLFVDEAVEHHSFDSRTQKATARFKSSRSIRNRAFSRRNSDSSWPSLLLSPSRSPRLISS